MRATCPACDGNTGTPCERCESTGNVDVAYHLVPVGETGDTNEPAYDVVVAGAVVGRIEFAAAELNDLYVTAWLPSGQMVHGTGFECPEDAIAALLDIDGHPAEPLPGSCHPPIGQDGRPEEER